MTSPQRLGRRVRQNTNDILDLYDITTETNQNVKTITAVQERHGNRLAMIGRTLDVHTTRLNRISGRLNHIETTQHHHTETLNAHSEKLDRIDGRLDKMDIRFDKMDSRLNMIIDLLGAK